MATITADGRTALAQYCDLVIRFRQLLDGCIERDAQALQILTGPALPEAIQREERRYWDAKAGRRKFPRVWTRRDEQRVNMLAGRFGGCRSQPECRVATVLAALRCRSGEARHDGLFRQALDEARLDGTAAVVAPALNELRLTFDRLLAEAHRIAQDEGDDREYRVAHLSVDHALGGVELFMRPGGQPEPTEDDDLPTLDEKAVKALECLSKFDGGTAQEQIANRLGINRNTLKPRLDTLRSLGYAETPIDRKNSTAITAKGITYLVKRGIIDPPEVVNGR